MNARRLQALLALFAVGIVLLPAGAGAGEPQAQSSAEGLVRYLTKGKLKPAKKIKFRFVCNAACSVRVSTTFKVPGNSTSPPDATGTLAADQIGIVTLTPNGPLLSAIKAHRDKSKLITKIVAKNLDVGGKDVDSRTFRFK